MICGVNQILEFQKEKNVWTVEFNNYSNRCLTLNLKPTWWGRRNFQIMMGLCSNHVYTLLLFL